MPDTHVPDATDVIELTRSLVRCESVTPREAGALQLLERILTPIGFRCERMDFTQAGTDDVANLYVMDGSTFPTSSGMNPTATIMAVAARSVLNLIERRGEVRAA